MYFFDENSKVHTGWLEVDGKKYYLNQDGVMVTGTQEIDGKQYTFNEKGRNVMQINQLIIKIQLNK